MAKHSKSLGWALKSLRTRPGFEFTQFDLAVKSGISINRIASIEAGRVEATPTDIAAFSKALKVKAEEIQQLAKSGTPLARLQP